MARTKRFRGFELGNPRTGLAYFVSFRLMAMIIDRARRILAPALKGTGYGNILVSVYRGGERVALQSRRVGIVARYCAPKMTAAVSWLVRSSEVSNFVYDLTESNKVYLAN